MCISWSLPSLSFDIYIQWIHPIGACHNFLESTGAESYDEVQGALTFVKIADILWPTVRQGVAWIETYITIVVA